MCKRVDVDPKDIDFTENDWFMKHSWPYEKEKEFIKWLSNYLYITPAARKEIMTLPLKRKKQCADAALQFTMSYGWKYKDEEDVTVR